MLTQMLYYSYHDDSPNLFNEILEKIFDPVVISTGAQGSGAPFLKFCSFWGEGSVPQNFCIDLEF